MKTKNIRYRLSLRKFFSIRLAAIMPVALLAALLGFGSGAASDREQAKRTIEEIESEYSQTSDYRFDPSGGVGAYLAYAALNNPGVRSAFYEWKAQLEKVHSVSALPDPMISYAYYVENVETRVGPQRHRFGIRQTIPWFGTLGDRADAAFEAAKAAYQNYQSEKLRLFYRLKRAYYEYYYLGRELELSRENFELLKFWEAVLRVRYEAALEKHPDVIKAQVELGLMEDKMRSLERKTPPAAAQLRAALNLPDSIDLPIPDRIPDEFSDMAGDSIIDLVMEHNPDLRAIEHTIEKEKAGERLAGKAYYPSFTFGVDYIATGKAINPDLAESGKDPWMVSVSINVPLWFGKNRARSEEAKARSRAARNRYDQAHNNLRAYTETVLFTYEDNLRKIRLYRDGLVPKAEQSLSATYVSYQAGESDFLSLLDAQRQLLEFQLQLDRARTEAAIARAELEMLAGSEIDGRE